MVAYNFQRQFAGPIMEGRKTSTIRAPRTRPHAAAGDVLQLYTGMRTKACAKLMVVPCTATETITLGREKAWIRVWGVWSEIDMAALAASEGFEGVDAMVRWFGETHGFPTPEMHRIRWNPTDAVFVAETLETGGQRP